MKKEVMERSEISENYKWDLDSVFKNEDEFKKEYKSLDKEIEELPDYEGLVTKTPESLGKFLDTFLSYERRIMKLFSYSYMKVDEDTRLSKSQELHSYSKQLYTKFLKLTAFVVPEILHSDEKVIMKWVNEYDKLKTYKKYIGSIYRFKKHTLSIPEEILLAGFTEVIAGPEEIYSMYSYADMKFEDALDNNGEHHSVDSSGFISLLKQEDRVLRKNVFESVYENYKNHNNFLAANLKNHVKSNIFVAKTRGYKSVLNMALYAENIDERIYDNLISCVHEKLPYLHRYMKIRKDLMKVDELHMYDIYLPIVKNIDIKISFEEAQEIILKALKPLGEYYTAIVKKGFNERWFDVYQNKGKKSGAYSFGSYDSKPFILLNYNSDLSSLFTTIHETGHSLHSYFTTENQPFHYSSYSIFLAEIASTLNESLLTQYMIENAANEEEKKYFINDYLETFRTTIYRQTMFAEFEREIYRHSEAGENLSAEYLNNIYLDLNKKYYGEYVFVDDYIKYEWSRINHFYKTFYVYQYATGLSAATEFTRLISGKDKENIDKYIKFLQAGNSAYPLDILKEAGVDMKDKAPVLNALEVFNNYLDKFEKMI